MCAQLYLLLIKSIVDPHLRSLLVHTYSTALLGQMYWLMLAAIDM